MLIISRFANKLHRAFSELMPTVGPDEIVIELIPSEDLVTVTIEDALVFSATLSVTDNDADHLWFSVGDNDPQDIGVRVGINFEELIRHDA